MVTTVSAPEPFMSNRSRTRSPACRLDAPGGSARSSGVAKSACAKGAASSTSRPVTGSAAISGRRTTIRASPSQNPDREPERTVRRHGTAQAFTRFPSSASRAGSTVTALTAAIATTAMPA